MTPQYRRYYRYFTYIKPVLKTPLVKTYGTTIFNIIAITIFIIFAIKPTVETILTLQKKISDSQTVLEQIIKKTDDLTLAKQNYQDLGSTMVTKIAEYIPNEPNLKGLIQQLEQVAQQNQASISALQIQPLEFDLKSDVNAQKLTPVEFTYNVQGTYQNIIAILNILQNNIRVITITNITINKTEESSHLLLSVSGKAYYLK